MSCPCGLSQERVVDLDQRDRVLLVGGKCQNPLADGSVGVCGKALGAHPLAQASGGSTVTSTGISQVQFSEIILKLDDLKASARKQRRITKIVAKEVIISHRARMDKWTSSKRTKQEQAEFKINLISFYQRAHPSDPNQLKCMVVDSFFPRQLVRASHIWKFETEGDGLTEFGLHPSDLSNPRNGFLLCEDIEKAFGVKRVCVLVDRLRSNDLYIKVLDPFLLDPATSPVVCQGHTTLRFCDIDGLQLQCPPGCLPFRRILDFHAKCSFEKAINKGWLAPSISFADFFDMSVDSSIPDFNIYQGLDSDRDSDVDGDEVDD